MRLKAPELDIGAAMASSDSVCGPESGPAPVARPTTVDQDPNSASAFGQSGSLVEKEVLYRDVLELDPGNADALHLSWVISFLRKIIAGDPYRKTRFHDIKGNFVGVSQFKYLPRAVLDYTKRVALDIHPDAPWLTYNVVERINEIIRPDWKVIEFGSGRSTLWYAGRVEFVHSIEHDREWFEFLSAKIENKGIRNVRLDLWEEADYSSVDDYPDYYFDFAIVDGMQRSSCAKEVVMKVKEGGYLYLDNSDFSMTGKHHDFVVAEQTLMDAVRKRNGTYEFLTGFTIGRVNTHQGLLIRF